MYFDRQHEHVRVTNRHIERSKATIRIPGHVVTGIILLMLAIAGQAQTFTQYDKILSSDRRVLQHFGFSADLSGRSAIVGSFSSAYLYELSFERWQHVVKLSNPDRVLGNYGHTVAINSQYAFVGASGMSLGAGSSLKNAGAVYVYKRNSSSDTWEFTQRLVAGDPSGESYFGNSISATEKTLVVGAYLNSYGVGGVNAMPRAGAVYVFGLNSAGYWDESEKLTASNRSASDEFGSCVSISGNQIFVGAPRARGIESGQPKGAVYCFMQRAGGKWEETQRIIQSPSPNSYEFGKNVSISLPYALVGNDDDARVEVFQFNDQGRWEFDGSLIPSDHSPGNIFGGSLCISGKIAVVGAAWQKEQQQGAAYVYARSDSGIWIQTQKIFASDGTAGNEFGNVVRISDDNLITTSYLDEKDRNGENLLERAGSAYLFKLAFTGPRSTPPVDSTERCQAFPRRYLIPNIITPNGDEKNDRFFIGDLFERTSLQIFDRHGRPVYETRNYQNEWPANNFPSGTYYWRTIQVRSGCTESLKGWIQVIR